MVAANHNGSFDDTFSDQFVEGQSGLVTLAIAQPTDARGQTLELDLLSAIVIQRCKA